MTEVTQKTVKESLEAGEPTCVKCGNRRSEHHYRHPFQPSHERTLERMAPDLAAAYLRQAYLIASLEAELMETQDMSNLFATKEYHTEIRAKKAEAKLAQAVYVLGGVRTAIKTGRHEPLVVWAEQIDIALATLTGDKTDD